MGMRNSNKMSQREVVMQMMKKCSKYGKKQLGHESGVPLDVPKGHFVVYVGQNRCRYVVPISYLSRPEFQILLLQAEEEFGFHRFNVGLSFPCDQQVFHDCLVSMLN